MTTTERIAEVVQDLRTGKNLALIRGVSDELFKATRAVAADPSSPVIDCTSVYKAQMGKKIWLYEDHRSIPPPFPRALFCYENEHGNVVVMSMLAAEHDPDEDPPAWGTGLTRDQDGIIDLGELAEKPDWENVRWTLTTSIWVGGRSDSIPDVRRLATAGPVHVLRFAVRADGTPADLGWVQLMSEDEYPHAKHENWDMAQVTLLGALNFLGCRNVEIVEAAAPRQERRRMARNGLPTVHTINVFPPGKTTRTAKGAPIGGVPVSPVRGHFAHYGEQYGKGRLFGKLEGKFWIAPHIRGDGEVGEVDYKLHAGAQ